jgi:hypothetical protein
LFNVLNRRTERESSEHALISLKVFADFDSTMRRFESSRPSQAVTQLKIVASEIIEVPAERGLSQTLIPSLYSKFAQSPREIGDSLWLLIEIFPFLGDAGRRPGFELHCVASGAVSIGHFHLKHQPKSRSRMPAFDAKS